MPKDSERRVVVTRRVAQRWLRRVAAPEYRFEILYGAKDFKNLPNLLRTFRDGKVSLGVPTIPDLGIKEASLDSVSVWSKDRDALITLQNWFEKRGFETTGIW